MSADPQARCIVVGFYGSEVARLSVDYTLERAGAAGKVFVVHAFEPAPD